MNGSWDAFLASPADFAGADDIITNLTKEREPGIESIDRTPYSLIITSIGILYKYPYQFPCAHFYACVGREANLVPHIF